MTFFLKGINGRELHVAVKAIGAKFRLGSQVKPFFCGLRPFPSEMFHDWHSFFLFWAHLFFFDVPLTGVCGVIPCSEVPIGV